MRPIELTIKELKQQIETLPDNAIAYAYEGEVTGIVIVERFENAIKEIKFIHTQEPKTKS